MSIAHLLLQNLWWLPITLTAQNYQHSFVFIAFTLYHFTLKILVFNWRLLCLFSHLNFITALSTKAIAPIWQMTKRRLRAMSDFPLFTYLVPDSSLQFVPSRLFWLLHSWESGHRTFLNGSPLIDPWGWMAVGLVPRTLEKTSRSTFSWKMHPNISSHCIKFLGCNTRRSRPGIQQLKWQDTVSFLVGT